jgi:kynurenine formamidase
VTSPFGITWQKLAEARVIDLGHSWERGMPVSPNHPDFQMAMIRRHGDMVRADGGSAANEILVLGGHVGTHLDALGHVSHDGKLHGGLDATQSQSNRGLTALGIETVAPIWARGVLLDVAAVHGVDVLEPGHEITVDDLEEATRSAAVAVGEGDVALIRSGWAAHWEDPDLFRGQDGGAPGPGEEAARWLAERRIRATGAETIAYEVIRPGAGHATLPVHRILLVENGIHIMEAMDLSRLAAADVHEFLFVVAPLKIVGGTGSPIRPLAVVDG